MTTEEIEYVDEFGQPIEVYDDGYGNPIDADGDELLVSDIEDEEEDDEFQELFDGLSDEELGEFLEEAQLNEEHPLHDPVVELLGPAAPEDRYMAEMVAQAEQFEIENGRELSDTELALIETWHEQEGSPEGPDVQTALSEYGEAALDDTELRRTLMDEALSEGRDSAPEGAGEVTVADDGTETHSYSMDDAEQRRSYMAARLNGAPALPVDAESDEEPEFEQDTDVEEIE